MKVFLGSIVLCVLCCLDISAGQMIILRRVDGSGNFERGWTDYRNGFGSVFGEYWRGLQSIHTETNRRGYSLRVNLTGWDGRRYFADYHGFRVGPESEGYPLTIGDYLRTGTAGDSLGYHRGMKFSTYDNDNDNSRGNCARDLRGGFWYNDCARTNPTGQYLVGGVSAPYGITWTAMPGMPEYYSFREMTWTIS